MAGGGGGGGGGGNGNGGGGVGSGSLPLYILIGGSALPSGAGSSVFLDNGSARLDPGEMFIMTRDAMDNGATYRVSVEATVGGVDFNETFDFTVTDNPVPSQGSVIGELNELRDQAGAPPVASQASLTTAATRHAGYQCEKNQITHNEPDSSADFYVHTNFWSRISIANGGNANSNSWPGGSNVVYETIATNGDEEAVVFLWDTVYHRIPMMRRHTEIVGNGDRTEAFADALNGGGAVAANGANDYETLDYGGDTSIAQTAAFWPSDGLTGVPSSFNTDFESPDPVDSGNDNGTPDDDWVGVPIHVVIPSSGDFTAITVSVVKL